MDDPKFETGWLRTQNYEVLEPILTEAMKIKTTQNWVEELEQVGIPCGPVNTIPEVATDAHVAARDMIIEVEHPKSGRFKVVNTPFKFSRSRCQAGQACPDLGEHTQDTLVNLLKMTKEEINKLKDLRVI